MMGKLLKTTLVLLTALAIAFIALLMTFLWAPEVLINDRTLALSKYCLGKLGIEARWEEGHITVDSLSLFEKRINLALIDASFENESIAIAGDHIGASATLSLHWHTPLVTVIGPASATGVEFEWQRKPSTTDRAGKPINFESILQSLAQRRFEPVSISFNHWTIISEDGQELSGSADALLARQINNAWTLDLDIRGARKTPLRSLELAASAQFGEKGSPLDELFVNGQIAAVLSDGRKVTVDLGINPTKQMQQIDQAVPERRHQFDLAATYDDERRGKTTILRLLAQGAFDRRHISSSVEARLRALNGERLNLVLAPCQVKADSQDFLQRDIALQASCSGKVERPELDIPRELAALLPAKVNFAVNAKADIAVGRTTRIAETEIDLTVDETNVATVTMRGSAEAKATFDLSSPATPRNANARFDLNAHIDHFEHLVSRLRRTTWAVPAPFNQLGGPLSCGLKGQVDIINQGLELPISCRSDLRSLSQILAATADLRLKVKQQTKGLQPDLSGQIVINNIRFVLPDLNLTKPLPRLMPDNRIAAATLKKTGRALPLRYDITVKTADSDSLKIASELTGDPIPVGINLKLASDRGITGQVDLGRFDLELFRREAHVQYVNLAFEPNRESAGINGLIQFDNNDYRISLSLLGTTEQPKWRLYTEPPLPERDAIALLLFGRPPEELDEDAKQSSEEARAAIAQDAISLVSMYYLAATPIESIGYNPLTGVFTARVKLREGLTLTLGSDVEETSTIGLRKRIGRNWSVETTAVTAAGDDPNRGVAMLKWGRRY